MADRIGIFAAPRKGRCGRLSPPRTPKRQRRASERGWLASAHFVRSHRARRRRAVGALHLDGRARRGVCRRRIVAAARIHQVGERESSAHDGKLLVNCWKALAESLAHASSSPTVAVHTPVGLSHFSVVSAGAAWHWSYAALHAACAFASVSAPPSAAAKMPLKRQLNSFKLVPTGPLE